MNKNLLREELSAVGIEISLEQTDSLTKYYQLLMDWNAHTNLTAITDFREFINKHIIDSLIPLSFLAWNQGSVADVGSGAGFPGIPMAITVPGLNFTLMDSARKRTDFLQDCCGRLGISAKVIQERAETVGQHLQHREQYDFVISRAVAALPVLSELCLPLVRVGGAFASMKGPKAPEEIQAATGAITLLGGSISRVIDYFLPGGDKRSLVIIEKTSPTPSKYPRKPGTPEKRPLV